MSNRDTVLPKEIYSLTGTKSVSGRCVGQEARGTDPGHQRAEDSWRKGQTRTSSR